MPPPRELLLRSFFSASTIAPTLPFFGFSIPAPVDLGLDSSFISTSPSPFPFSWTVAEVDGLERPAREAGAFDVAAGAALDAGLGAALEAGLEEAEWLASGIWVSTRLTSSGHIVVIYMGQV